MIRTRFESEEHSVSQRPAQSNAHYRPRPRLRRFRCGSDGHGINVSLCGVVAHSVQVRPKPSWARRRHDAESDRAELRLAYSPAEAGTNVARQQQAHQL